MLERKKFNGSNAANLSIEISLTAIMGMIILFFVLTLFGNNIKMLADASNFGKMFLNNDKKTFQNEVKYKNNDPTKTQINVQLVGEQGLNYYISSALSTIEKYKQTPPESEAQIEDLAKAAAIAELFNKLSPNDTKNFYNTYSIVLDEGGISVGTKKLTHTNLNDIDTSDDIVLLNTSKEILNSSFK